MSEPSPGLTATERYLNRLARRSFLSIWSHPGPYRDQGVGARGEGAEVCDLLVVFENRIIIFSDKDCEFPMSEDVELAWRRWFKKAILKSAQQVWGAERWIREHPDRLFVDRACQKPFPLGLPTSSEAIIHRVVVAHDTSGRRRRAIGGSGTLLVQPSLVGDAHFLSSGDGGQPFAVGRLDPQRGFVHVFDDVSLSLVLSTLDTITDFVWYLERKERFLESGRLFGAFGEEDLLAYYLKNTNEAGDHDFVVPTGAQQIVLEEGHWADFQRRPERKRQLRANEESYLWDATIEEVARHAIAGSLEYTSGPELSEQERLLRVLAREPRVRRRLLARALLEKIRAGTPKGKCGFRVVEPSFPGDPYYVFVVANPKRGVAPGTPEWDIYRNGRRSVLAAYCLVAMRHFGAVAPVVGIATEGEVGSGRSHDLYLVLPSAWDDEMEKEASEIQAVTGWFTKVLYNRSVEEEYPDAPPRRSRGRIGRNDRCPCGSNRKFKKCCGSRV